ncbi:hypothetical protein CLOP_g3342 [Closterium sp. NIES-67]|nr:hypothetical protein CLOP_g3342 [Closterium sp. NIES-67]
MKPWRGTLESPPRHGVAWCRWELEESWTRRKLGPAARHSHADASKAGSWTARKRPRSPRRWALDAGRQIERPTSSHPPKCGVLLLEIPASARYVQRCCGLPRARGDDELRLRREVLAEGEAAVARPIATGLAAIAERIAES